MCRSQRACHFWHDICAVTPSGWHCIDRVRAGSSIVCFCVPAALFDGQICHLFKWVSSGFNTSRCVIPAVCSCLGCSGQHGATAYTATQQAQTGSGFLSCCHITCTSCMVQYVLCTVLYTTLGSDEGGTLNDPAQCCLSGKPGGPFYIWHIFDISTVWHIFDISLSLTCCRTAM